MRWPLVLLLAIIGLALAAWFAADEANARWKASYSKAEPKIKAWYHNQHNAHGDWCCDESDGHPYFGSYTLNQDGSVTLELKDGKRTLPSYMVLKGPNPTGAAVWWYIQDSAGGITDFCFAPGTLT